MQRQTTFSKPPHHRKESKMGVCLGTPCADCPKWLCPQGGTYSLVDTFPVDGVPNTAIWEPQATSYIDVDGGRLTSESDNNASQIETVNFTFDHGNHTQLDMECEVYFNTEGQVIMSYNYTSGIVGLDDFVVRFEATNNPSAGGGSVQRARCSWDFKSSSGGINIPTVFANGDVISIEMVLTTVYTIDWKVNGTSIHQLVRAVPADVLGFCTSNSQFLIRPYGSTKTQIDNFSLIAS